MFRLLGSLVTRLWPALLLGWIGLAAVLYFTAPPWNEVAQDQEFGYLPEDVPSRQGGALLKQAFPNDLQASEIVIIITRHDGELQERDRAFVHGVVKPALVKLANEGGGLADHTAAASSTQLPIVANIRAWGDRYTGQLLISEDRRSALVLMELTTELLERRNWDLVAKVERLINQWNAGNELPSGLTLALNGDAVVGRDMTRGQQESASKTELWTIIAVVVILGVIYRAPLLALIPLISVFMATFIARLALAHLAGAKIVTLFEGIEIFITILLYGTGVDYCLFLVARYREEREKGADWPQALAQAIEHVGPALTASAATVIFGIAMMTFAKFGKFHHAGISVALSLVLGWCVVLTFTTSLLRLFGRWAFWPKSLATQPAGAPAEEHGGRFTWLSWDGLARLVITRPATVWLVSVVVMMPLAVVGVRHLDHIDYDFIRRLPADAPSVAGAAALEEHFPSGAAGIVTVIIHEPNIDFLEEDGVGQIEISELTDRLHKKKTQLKLADIRSWSKPLGYGHAAREATGLPLPIYVEGLKQATAYYISSQGELKGHVTRLELMMTLKPMSRAGMASLNQLEETLRAELPAALRNANVYFLGVTSDMHDLRATTAADQTRIQILVVACVLLILIALLRRPLVSLYLIVSVLFSYFATLGTAMLLFSWLNGDNFAGLDWKVPIFLFTILVAIGEDYNIFLMTRIHEEQESHGPIDGIRIALVRTGRIITSCGIIMAGTFASLLAGTMEDLRHLGFALAFGVLVDTFVVRPILVPSFLVMLERGRTIWNGMQETAKKKELEKISH
jgi:putative drug exporter of the RND superfamily